MSMHVVFLKDHEHYREKSSHIVPRALGVILTGKGVAVPWTEYQATLRKEAELKAAEKVKAEKEKAEKEAAEKVKKDKLLKAKEAAESETAESKVAKTRSKAVKK